MFKRFSDNEGCPHWLTDTVLGLKYDSSGRDAYKSMKLTVACGDRS